VSKLIQRAGDPGISFGGIVKGIASLGGKALGLASHVVPGGGIVRTIAGAAGGLAGGLVNKATVTPAMTGLITSAFREPAMNIAPTIPSSGRSTFAPTTAPMPKVTAMSAQLSQASAIQTAGVIPSLPIGSGKAIVGTVGKALPGLIGAGKKVVERVFRSPTGQIIVGTVIGGWIYDKITGNVIGRVKQRRMNPMNFKAFRRAARRIKGAVRWARRVERALPTRRTRGGKCASCRTKKC